MPQSTEKISILHVTPWFPTVSSPESGIWIKRQIGLLDEKFENYIIHIKIETGSFSRNIVRTINHSLITCHIPWEQWRLKEYVFYKLLKRELIHLNKTFDFALVNFHIAYPALIYLNSLEKYLPQKKIITEHWSAYHFNFHSQSNLSRIKKIFKRGIPVICVSETLKEDIIRFSGIPQQISIVPNQIDETIFFHSKKERRGFYFMAAIWAFPKKPFEILEEWKKDLHKKSLPNLHIAGLGPLWKEIADYVEVNHLSDRVKLLGSLSPSEIAREMNLAEALLLPSEYETFSVISIEALFCGLPVITNEISVFQDVLTPSNGIMRKPEETWLEAIQRLPTFDIDERQRISDNAIARFNTKRTKRLYESIIEAECSK